MDVYLGERVLLGEELVAAAVLVQGGTVREIVRGCTKADDEKLRQASKYSYLGSIRIGHTQMFWNIGSPPLLFAFGITHRTKFTQPL